MRIFFLASPSWLGSQGDRCPYQPAFSNECIPQPTEESLDVGECGGPAVNMAPRSLAGGGSGAEAVELLACRGCDWWSCKIRKAWNSATMQVLDKLRSADQTPPIAGARGGPVEERVSTDPCSRAREVEMACKALRST